MMIGKIGDWSLHGSGLVTAEEAATMHDLNLLYERFAAEERATRKRLAQSLHKAKKRATAKGYRAGFEDAGKTVITAFARHLKVWENAQRHFKETAEKALREVLGEMPANALLAARIHKCLLEARQNPVLRIHVHPAQFAFVDEFIAKFDEQTESSGCEVVADPYLGIDECRVETETGVLSLNFDRQVRALCEILLADTTDQATSTEGSHP